MMKQVESGELNGSIDSAAEFDWESFAGGRGPRLRRIVAGLVKAFYRRATADHIDEVVQETLLRMFSSRRFGRDAVGRSMAEVEAYFRRVARTVLVDDLRRSSALKRSSQLVDATDSLEELIDDGVETPEDILLRTESRCLLAKRLQAALPGRCSQRYRDLLERVVFDEERPCDLARASRGELSSGAAYIALHRMRRCVVAKGREVLLN